MKRKVVLSIVVFFLLPCIVFADSEERQRARIRDANSRNLSLIASGENYSLYADKNGCFYLYSENWLSNAVYLYRGNGKVTKGQIEAEMNEASSVSKIIDTSYTVYYVSMSLFSETHYYVKTPKGDFYSISEKIKTINASASKFIDEL